MKKILLNDITVEFNENQIEEYLKLKKYMEKNISLFSFFFDNIKKISLCNSKEDVYYISDVDEFFYNYIDKLFKNEKMKEAISQDAFVPSLYLEYVIRSLGKLEDAAIPINTSMSDGLLITHIAYKYFVKS